MTKATKNRAVIWGLLVFLAATGAGVAFHSTDSDAKAKKEAAAAPPAAPAGPPQVVVQTIAPQNVRVWSSFSGRLNAVDFAEIRPEVSGRIMEIKFKDGQDVKAGDVLFVIDPRPYEAAAAKAEASIATAKTNAAYAKTELDRANNLVKTQAIATRVLDEKSNDERVAKAAQLSADADLKQAKIDLDHAYVKAPISGRVSRAEITVGNLVQAGPGAPLLTSIVSSDGIYADFEIDEQTYMKSIRGEAATTDQAQQIPVELTVQGDEAHPYKGTIYSFDNKIDTASGTIRARAKFANEDGRLMPGMFVSIKLASVNEDAALLVPDSALGTDQNKKFIYTVSADNKVVYHEVKLGEQAEKGRIVLSGITAGDRVIVQGGQMLHPDVVVVATEAPAEAPAAAPADAAPADAAPAAETKTP